MLRRGFDFIRTSAKIGLVCASGSLFYAYVSDTRSGIHRYLILPAMRSFLDAEQSHWLTILICKYGICPKDRLPDDPRLNVEVFIVHVAYSSRN